MFIEKHGEDYCVSGKFKALLKNKNFDEILKELTEFGISRFSRDYSSGYKNSDLVLYQKYTYEDVCRLLNWEKSEVPVREDLYEYIINT